LKMPVPLQSRALITAKLSFSVPSSIRR
jgi:hypothetical protein